MTTFGQINLLVADMAATVAFYRLLELEFSDALEWPADSGAKHIDDIHADTAHMAFDNPPMARIWSGGYEPDRVGGNVVIGLMVPTRDDVDRLRDEPVRRRVGPGDVDVQPRCISDEFLKELCCGDSTAPATVPHILEISHFALNLFGEMLGHG